MVTKPCVNHDDLQNELSKLSNNDSVFLSEQLDEKSFLKNIKIISDLVSNLSLESYDY
jgi:hypothetical protein